MCQRLINSFAEGEKLDCILIPPVAALFKAFGRRIYHLKAPFQRDCKEQPKGFIHLNRSASWFTPLWLFLRVSHWQRYRLKRPDLETHVLPRCKAQSGSCLLVNCVGHSTAATAWTASDYLWILGPVNSAFVTQHSYIPRRYVEM